MQSAFAGNTTDTYSSSFKSWIKFCDRCNYPVWTVSEQKLIEYVAYRFICTPVVHRTVVKDLSGIRKQFIVSAIPFPERATCVKLQLILRGYKRLRSTDHSKRPLNSKHLLSFFAKLNRFGNLHNIRLYKAILSVAFQGLLRVSEYAAGHRSDMGFRTLRFANLRFHPTLADPKAIEILLAQTKTDQYGICKEAVAFECTCESKICAFHSLLDYVRECRSTADSSDPLFVFADQSIVSVRDINRLIDRMCTEIGIPKQHYSSHSMRSGGATELYLAGVPIDVIQRLGRWSPTGSTLQKRYLKPTPIHVRQLVTRFETNANNNRQNGKSKTAARCVSRVAWHDYLKRIS
jgi:hypothetical protein